MIVEPDQATGTRDADRLLLLFLSLLGLLILLGSLVVGLDHLGLLLLSDSYLPR